MEYLWILALVVGVAMAWIGWRSAKKQQAFFWEARGVLGVEYAGSGGLSRPSLEGLYKGVEISVRIHKQRRGNSSQVFTEFIAKPHHPLPEGLAVSRELQSGMLRPRDLQVDVALDASLRIYGSRLPQVSAFFEACAPAVVDLFRLGAVSRLNDSEGAVVRHSGLVSSSRELAERLDQVVSVAQRLDALHPRWSP